VLKDAINELGELYFNCSTHLFQNFQRAGISYWWENKPGCPKGGAIFTYYDSDMTCLRLMPNAPNIFHASVSNNVISHTNALVVSHELLTTLGSLLDEYSGFFAPEIKTGPVGQSVRYAAEPHARSILAAHRNLGPDELYAAMPWPLMPEFHFRLGVFSRAGIQGDYIEIASQAPLRAMSIAIDIVSRGASLKMESITSRLNWMKGRRRSRLAIDSEHDFGWDKILVPCFAGGFQGITFALFERLPLELHQFVMSELQQFSATVGEAVAKCRQQYVASTLARCSNLREYANAFMTMLPPAEHVLFLAGGERLGFSIAREANYLAGYRSLHGEALNAAFSDLANAPIGGCRQPQIFAKFLTDPEAPSPVFMLLRLNPHLTGLPPLPIDDVHPLSRMELGQLSHGLRRQIKDGHGAMAASKKLFLVETALQDFDAGEAVLSNSKARQYTERVLGKPNQGYHVAGKAAKKFEEDIRKLVPKRFLFESVSAHSVRVRWRPAPEIGGNSERIGSPRGHPNVYG
jgi:hypothetical protein